MTCYTDASFHHERGGGWAVWLKCSEGKLVKSGRCPEYVEDSNVAELSAIFAGVWLAVTRWPKTSVVLVCSDCTGALRIAQCLKEPNKEGAKRLQQKIKEVRESRGIWVRTRWVKGHRNPRSDKGSYLNHTCDRLARKEQEKGRCS